MRRSIGRCSEVTQVGLIVALAVSVGCRQEPSRWEEAQSSSEGRTAQEASAERLGAPEGTEPDGSDATAPPPYTPDAPSAPDAPVTWKPKGDQAVSTERIDPAKLASGDPLPGSEFNQFFPEQAGDYDMVAKQEKAGFAEYSLRRGGEEIGQLSVTDLRTNPQAAEKFQQPDMMIRGYPAKKDGSKGTTVLVGQRFQVKVRSPGGELDEQDRMKWLEQFDLAGISALAD